MIRIPEDGWGFGPAGDSLPTERGPSTNLLSGRSAPLDDGYLVVPRDGWGMVQPTADDDPVTKADDMKARAQRALDLMQTTTAANRALDTLVAGIVDGPDWRDGLLKFDKGLAELRQKHRPRFTSRDDEDVFTHDLDEFASMRRIALKRALVEKQQSEALAALDDTLDYYASEASSAANEVFRDIAASRGLKAIETMQQAGYLFPDGATKLAAAFRTRLDSADLEAVVKADPDNALVLLDDARLFPNADGAARDRLRQQVAGLTGKIVTDAVPVLGKGLPYLIGEAVRAGDHPESARKDPVLGVSVGAGEMPDAEAKRVDGPVDREADDDGDDAAYSSDKPGYHRYVQGPTALGTVAEGLTEAMVKDALRCFAVPGQSPSKPVENNKIYAVYPPGGRDSHYSVGHVRTTVADDGMSIRNKAQRGHIFYPGNIDRRIHLENGTWYVTTIGEGNNERPIMDKMNQYGGPVVFERVDGQMKKYLRDRIAK